MSIDFKGNNNKFSNKEERYNFYISINKDMLPLVRLRYKLINKNKTVGQMNLFEFKLENNFNIKISLSKLILNCDDVQFYFTKNSYFEDIKNASQLNYLRRNTVKDINSNINNFKADDLIVELVVNLKENKRNYVSAFCLDEDDDCEKDAILKQSGNFKNHNINIITLKLLKFQINF